MGYVYIATIDDEIKGVFTNTRSAEEYLEEIRFITPSAERGTYKVHAFPLNTILDCNFYIIKNKIKEDFKNEQFSKKRNV